MPYTCKCGQVLDLIAALEALPSGHMGKAGRFISSCRGCGDTIEIRLRNGSFEFGYSYFGGSMHFDAVGKVRVAGLKLTPSDPDNLDVVLGSRHWHFGIRQVSHHRFVVFPQAFVAGKRLGELDFAQWKVALAYIERETARLEPTADIVIAAGDCLHLAGPDPALTRAWHYMNDGRSRTA